MVPIVQERRVTSLRHERVHAYRFIKLAARIRLFARDFNLKNTLSQALAMPAETVDVIRQNMEGLRKGSANPGPELVRWVREFVGPTVCERDIEAALIEPFAGHRSGR